MMPENSSRVQVWVVSCGLFLASLFLTAYSSRHPAVARLGSTIMLEVVSPMTRVIEVLRDVVGGVAHRYLLVVHAARDNEDMRRRLLELESRLTSIGEIERENLRLRQLLNFSSSVQLQGVAGSVIGADPSGWVKGITIDRGSVHGVATGMAVVDTRGIVGQVAAVSSYSSRVLLVNDHASGVDVLIQSSRARGVAEGAGDRGCDMKFVTKDTLVKVGDLVVTSGMDQVYPKGLTLGTVAQVMTGSGSLFQTVVVKPSVDFSRLEEVLIVGAGAGTHVRSSPGES